MNKTQKKWSVQVRDIEPTVKKAFLRRSQNQKREKVEKIIAISRFCWQKREKELNLDYDKNIKYLQ